MFEAFGPMHEIEALSCECGCTLEVVGWLGEDGEDHAPFVALLPMAA